MNTSISLRAPASRILRGEEWENFYAGRLRICSGRLTGPSGDTARVRFVDPRYKLVWVRGRFAGTVDIKILMAHLEVKQPPCHWLKGFEEIQGMRSNSVL